MLLSRLDLLGFDATGGGKLASQILTAMEIALTKLQLNTAGMVLISISKSTYMEVWTEILLH